MMGRTAVFVLRTTEHEDIEIALRNDRPTCDPPILTVYQASDFKTPSRYAGAVASAGGGDAGDPTGLGGGEAGGVAIHGGVADAGTIHTYIRHSWLRRRSRRRSRPPPRGRRRV